MKNSSKKTPKTLKRAILGIILGVMSCCAILPAFTASADHVSPDDFVGDALNAFYSPFAGTSVTCYTENLGSPNYETYDMPTTFGDTTYASIYSERYMYGEGGGYGSYYVCWQNTQSGAIRVLINDEEIPDDVMYMNEYVISGYNVAIPREYLLEDTWAFSIPEGNVYEIELECYTLDVQGLEQVYTTEYVASGGNADFFDSGNACHKFNKIFTPAIPDEAFSGNLCIFTYFKLIFRPIEFNAASALGIIQTNAATRFVGTDEIGARAKTYYDLRLNRNALGAIMSFPIAFLNTEIFPSFSFGMLLLIMLGIVLFGFGLKISLGG